MMVGRESNEAYRELEEARRPVPIHSINFDFDWTKYT